MKKNTAAIALSILLMAAFGSAQQSKKIHGKIPFEFTAADKVLPAGDYEFSYDAARRFVLIKSAEKGAEIIMPIVTLLAGETRRTSNESNVVFDKIGENH